MDLGSLAVLDACVDSSDAPTTSDAPTVEADAIIEFEVDVVANWTSNTNTDAEEDAKGSK